MALPDHLRRLLADCDVETYRSSGPGGQKKNKTESSVRVRHRPTGLVRIGTESRSQTRNREAALERLWNALEARARRPKPRKASAPTHASKVRRLAEKLHVAAIKRGRASRGDDD
jgi:protein subunit release factor B